MFYQDKHAKEFSYGGTQMWPTGIILWSLLVVPFLYYLHDAGKSTWIAVVVLFMLLAFFILDLLGSGMSMEYSYCRVKFQERIFKECLARRERKK